MMTYNAFPRQVSGLVRLRPGEAGAAGPRRRRPHPAGTVERMREFYETTRLSTRAIAAATGANAATVSRRARRHGWLRPDPGLPEEHYSAAGRRKLRRGAIAEGLLRKAERLAFRREMDPRTSARQLGEALRLVRAARALDEDERPRRTGRKRRTRHPANALELEKSDKLTQLGR
jgi:hypothetical protein